MKKISKLFFAFFLLVVLSLFTSPVMAYEQAQLEDCMLSASENSAIKGVSDSSIENYCDSALDLIVDQKKDVRESGYECAIRNFG